MNEPVLTLEALKSWPRSDGKTHLAVLGFPIKHSVSPPMHNAALAKLAETDARFANWRYHRFEVHPNDLPHALDEFLAAGFLGLNLTVPHKVIAFDKVYVTEGAKPIGAVNTLVRDARHPNGWIGFNTDGYGLAKAIEEELNIEIGGSDILLLGAGGAARGAAVQCMQAQCYSLNVLNRSPQAMHELVALAKSVNPKIPARGILPNDLSHIGHSSLVINATSAGLKPDDPQPVDLAALPRPRAVYDMIYNPAETKLLAQARALGIPAANGLGMLVHQGARSLQHWIQAATGRADVRIPVDVMRAAAERALAGH